MHNFLHIHLLIQTLTPITDQLLPIPSLELVSESLIQPSFIFETESCYVAQVGLELSVLLPQPPPCWITTVYRHAWLSLGLGFSSGIIISFLILHNQF